MATPRKYVREYVSSRYSGESRKLPHLFYISDNILPFRSLGDTEAHGVIGNHNIETAQPLIQSSLIPGQTQLRQSRGMSKSGYTSRFPTKHSSQPRSLPVCLQRMATGAALLKDSPATHRIAGPCGSNLASSRVLAQHVKSLDVARRKLRLRWSSRYRYRLASEYLMLFSLLKLSDHIAPILVGFFTLISGSSIRRLII